MDRKRGEVSASFFDDEKLDKLCDWIAEGNSMISFFKENEDMGNRSSFYRWLRNHATEEQKELYDQANIDGEYSMFDDCIAIADHSEHDTIYTERGEKPDKEWIARSKLRVETRYKALARRNPKKWGEATLLKLGAEKEDEVVEITMSMGKRDVGGSSGESEQA